MTQHGKARFKKHSRGRWADAPPITLLLMGQKSFYTVWAGSSHSSRDLGLYTYTARENAVVEQIMEVIERHGLSADHAKEVLGRTIQLLEWGKKAAQELSEGNA